MKMNNSSKNNIFMKNNLSKLFIFIGLFIMMFLLNGSFVNAACINAYGLADGSAASVGDSCCNDLLIAGYCRAAGSCAISAYGGRSCSTDNTYISAAGTCTTSGCDYGDTSSICGATCTPGTDTFYGDCAGNFGSSCDSDAYGGFTQDGLCAKTYANDQYGSCVTSFVCNNSGYIVTTSACNVAAPCDATLTNGDFSAYGVACSGSCVGTSASNCCTDAQCPSNKYCSAGKVCTCRASSETVCDGLDDDCDGSIDEGLSPPPASRDVDDDGYPGTLKVGFIGCAIPEGFAADSMGTDCDETNSAVNPGAAEILCNGINDDCNVATSDTACNNGCGIYADSTCSSGSCTACATSCTSDSQCDSGYYCGSSTCRAKKSDYVMCWGDHECISGNCDGVLSVSNSNHYCHSTASSCINANINGELSTGTVTCAGGTVGNSALATCSNGAWSLSWCTGSQTCTLGDNACKSTYYFDWDGDNYGTSTIRSSMSVCTSSCSGRCDSLCCPYPSKCDGTACCSYQTPTRSTSTTAPASYSTVNTDCVDNNAAISPGATESCNAVDDNCDGSLGTNENIQSTGTEFCDGFDNNCDGTADNIVPASRSCSITNGAGSQTIYCSGSSVAYGTCTVTSCNSGYTSCANACNANVVDCTASIPNAASATKTGSCTSNVWNAGTCTLHSCTSDYKISGNTCIPKTKCSDGIIQTPNDYGTNEICDINAFNGVVCTSLISPNPRGMNYNGGTLGCSACTAYDTALCTYCGDGVKQASEQCDLGAANGDNAACRTDCKHNCYVTSVTILNTSDCYGYNCHEGDRLSVKVDYSSQCNLAAVAANKIQIDFFSGATAIPSGNSCVIADRDADMQGITRTGTLSGTSTTFDYIIPAIPTICSGKGLKNISVTIRNAANTILTPDNTAYSSHVYYNKQNTLTAPIVMSTACEGYVQYNKSKGFEEFKSFLAPSNGVIKYVCDGNNPRVAVNTALPPTYFKSPTITSGGYTLPVCFDSYTVKGAYTAQTIASATQFCVEKNQGYISGTFANDDAIIVSTKNPCWLWKNGVWAKDTSYTNKTIKCFKYGSSSNNEDWVVQIPGTVTDTNFACSDISDGLCPNDFSTTPLCGDATNGYTDIDCGVHEFVKCLPIVDVDGTNPQNKNTCDAQILSSITPDSWCAIQEILPNINKTHTQCVGGAVIQDPVTKCPKCLMPGEEVVYDLGVDKYEPTIANPLNKIRENMTLAVTDEYVGKYYTCPSKKYDLSVNGKQCEPSPDKCDEGYRTTTSNGLQFGCNEPATFANGKWTLKTACLGKVGTQYTTYCGLNSWYKNYEIYDDQFKIVVR